ncbi:uncharacterized protein I303_104308 [Kwoniella dejecticola CBS 10117]|uniref:Uncharacterized protein n=1 Tax=Kwoniella dejecticola CBS 10117 TaxID=1296121 RepID=A0A1A6A5Q0_9TREE|nr:uncharacterized protein I303_04718 [Kwoniella dejecticola CBS 10117]OBR85383.1 hypothetical protein I303_04718 [Kwoniella dejecticola CBS 10117]
MSARPNQVPSSDGTVYSLTSYQNTEVHSLSDSVYESVDEDFTGQVPTWHSVLQEISRDQENSLDGTTSQKPSYDPSVQSSQASLPPSYGRTISNKGKSKHNIDEDGRLAIHMRSESFDGATTSAAAPPSYESHTRHSAMRKRNQAIFPTDQLVIQINHDDCIELDGRRKS